MVVISYTQRMVDPFALASRSRFRLVALRSVSFRESRVSDFQRESLLCFRARSGARGFVP